MDFDIDNTNWKNCGVHMGLKIIRGMKARIPESGYSYIGPSERDAIDKPLD